MENWQDLYLELAQKASNEIAEISWVDLWHNQVNFLQEEHPFPTPALFISFRSKAVNDLGEKVQQLMLQIDFYLFYETFSDTFNGSFNQDEALDFIRILDKVNGIFHGTSGENYSSMRKTGFNPVDTGGAGNLYQVSFECLIHDESAVKFYEEGAFTGLEIEKNGDYQIQ